MEKSELNKIKDKNCYFEQKYHMSYFEFEVKIKCQTQENFSQWDDYMEWKSYLQKEQNLLHEKNNQ